MAKEIDFQKEVLRNFREKLGYTQCGNAEFNSEWLLIPRALKAFILGNPPQNAKVKRLTRERFNGSESLFWEAFYKAASDFVYGKDNCAIRMNPKRPQKFNFEGVPFTLFFPFEEDGSIPNENTYQVVDEVYFKELCVQPDVLVCMNGFLVSYIELKYSHNGETAKENGRGKIINDYLEASRKLKRCTEEEKETRMRVLHRLVHWVALDESDAYVMRPLETFKPAVQAFLKEGLADDQRIKQDIEAKFYQDPVFTKGQGAGGFEAFLKNTYSKQALKNEILYYNFIAYPVEVSVKRGKKKARQTDKTGYLCGPRPNQKFGVDKVIDDVCEKYLPQNERNPKFELEQLAKTLEREHLSPVQKEEILLARQKNRPNTNQYNLLLQYAAGFGKTYVLCWLAMRLKDLFVHKTREVLFDKILVISDRVELREQIDDAMSHMNVNKGVCVQANTRVALLNALRTASTRIVVVNIQKFPFLKEELGRTEGQETLAALKDKRVAFLIDEIHRSNSGIQHAEMINLFDELDDVLGQAHLNDKKKNLIVGLTATPTEASLARFGEYKNLEHVKWVPFDSYSMDEAIEDGFVLNPVKGLLPYAVEIKIEEPGEGEETRVPTKSERYELPDFIETTAKVIVNTLLNTTYKQIGRTGKAMLCCNSIQAANMYFDAIRKEFERVSEEHKDHVYMVYTTPQREGKAHVKCVRPGGGSYASEAEVIAGFKNDKNGLMIVVDKLQTGFDEPKLHTLFLAKEVSGISAVQTLCRVNRTMKRKSDCLVIDFSIDNVNMGHIKAAFQAYSGIKTSELDVRVLTDRVVALYDEVQKIEFIKAFFGRPNLLTTDKLKRQFVADKMSQDTFRVKAVQDAEVCLTYKHYANMVKSIVDLTRDCPHIKSKEWNGLIDWFIEEVRKNLQKDGNAENLRSLMAWIESHGFVDAVPQQVLDAGKSEENTRSKIKQQTTGSGVVDKILEMNAQQEWKEEAILGWQAALEKLFVKMKETAKHHKLVRDDVDEEKAGRLIQGAVIRLQGVSAHEKEMFKSHVLFGLILEEYFTWENGLNQAH